MKVHFILIHTVRVALLYHSLLYRENDVVLFPTKALFFLLYPCLAGQLEKLRLEK